MFTIFQNPQGKQKGIEVVWDDKILESEIVVIICVCALKLEKSILSDSLFLSRIVIQRVMWEPSKTTAQK